MADQAPRTNDAITFHARMFRRRVAAVLDVLREQVPNLVVNLLGLFKVSEIHELVKQQDYWFVASLQLRWRKSWAS